MSAKGNSQFTVYESGGEKYFFHGVSMFEVLPASILKPGDTVIVRPRSGPSDEGRTVDGEVEGTTRFAGLEKSVPVEARAGDGTFDLLFPEWFENGDEVQLPLHSSTLWSHRDKAPGLFEWSQHIVPSPQQRVTLHQARVRVALDEFCEAWNAGDVESACDLYAEDAIYCFLQDGKVVMGREAIVEMYTADDPGRVGLLSLDVDACVLVGEQIRAIIRFHLKYEDGQDAAGYSFAVFEEKGGELVLIYDTSFAD